MNGILRKAVWIAVMLFVCLETSFASGSDRGKRLENSVPKFIYVHVGVGGNMFVVGSEDMERAMEPFTLGPVNFGYSYYLNSGIRNIVQFEFRWGKDSNSFFHDDGFTQDFKIKRTTVPMEFSHEQWLVKVNPAFFVRKLRTWALFVVWGQGNVDYRSEAGDGFHDGTKTILGLELGRIFKFVALTGSIEKHDMTFERISVDGFGSLVQDFDASYLQFNVKFAVGLGF